MKTKKMSLTLVMLSILLVVLAGCDRAWDNPWDDHNDLMPEDWAPLDLRIVQSNSFDEVILEWLAHETRHAGYRIMRETNSDGNWVLVETLHAESIQNMGNPRFTDRGVNLQHHAYSYRVNAFVGTRQSGNTQEARIRLPEASTLRIDVVSGAPEVFGIVGSGGSSTVTQRGFLWGDTSSLWHNDNHYLGKTEQGGGTGSFSFLFSGLDAGKTYYFRAYATNGQGTGYGSVISFETPP